MMIPISAKKIDGAEVESSIPMPTIGDFSLYIHIPFCTKKCSYCHFFVLKDNQNAHHTLIEALKLEWSSILPSLLGKNLVSVYFGGGTPALLGVVGIQKIMHMIFKDFDLDPSIEITLEANPENITYDLMKGFSNLGINRISIGVQTLDDHLLQKIGRSHNSNRAIEAVKDTFLAGIKNISIDLMYDLPGQTISSWEDTLKRASELPISHLSLYNLTIEPKTLFSKRKKEIVKELPSDQESLQMYTMAKEKLQTVGLLQYEISAFSHPKAHSLHNTGYWLGRPFLGLGPSAFSFWSGKRWQNCSHLNKYAKSLEAKISPIDFIDTLEPESRKRELFAIAMRLNQGVDVQEFEKRWGAFSSEMHQSLQHLQANGILFKNKERLCLTDKGILFYDSFASEVI